MVKESSKTPNSYTNGENTAQVVIYSGENYEKQATSAWFNFDGERAIAGPGTLPSTPDWPLLKSALEELANIARGVQANYTVTDTEDPAYIKNKPVIPSTPEEVGAAAESHAAQHGPDGADPVTPIAHAARHATDGADAIPPHSIGAEQLRLQFINTVVPTASLVARDLKDGENMFDGALEQGSLNDSTGAEETSANHIRSTNDIAVIAEESYSYSDVEEKGARIFWFSDAAFLSYSDVASGGTITAPAGATKLRVRIYDSGGIIPSDIAWVMVNFGSTAEVCAGYIDPDYYPYHAKVTLAGALKGMVPDVDFEEKDRPIFAGNALAYDGGIKIFSSEIPSVPAVIQCVIIWKAVS